VRLILKRYLPGYPDDLKNPYLCGHESGFRICSEFSLSWSPGMLQGEAAELCFGSRQKNEGCAIRSELRAERRKGDVELLGNCLTPLTWLEGTL